MIACFRWNDFLRVPRPRHKTLRVIFYLLPMILLSFALAAHPKIIGFHSSFYRTCVATKLARCLLVLNPFKKIAVSILLVAFSLLCSAQSAPELIYVGDGAISRYFLIADSIQSKSGTIRYKISGVSSYSGGPTFTSEVGVDCVRRTRTEYLTVVTSKDSRTNTTSDGQARTVFDGTRQASELETVCDLAAKRLATAPVVLAASPSPLGEVTLSQLPECGSGWRHNCFGTATNSITGTKYVGEWKNSLRDGQGTFTYPDGNKYVGAWMQDRRSGQGIEYSSSGSITKQGRWENGNLVQSFAVDTQLFPFYLPTQTASATQATVPDPVKVERDRLAAELEASRKNAKDLEERLAVAQAASSQTIKPTLGVPTGRRVALVIGNAQYKSSPLENSVNDATDIDQALKRFGFQTTFLRNASLSQMRESTRRFADQLTTADVALIYFAGHGIESKNKNYMIPVNSDLKFEYELADQAYDAGAWLEMLEMIKSNNAERVNIVILDACRNNNLIGSRSLNRGLGRMDAPAGTFLSYSTAPGKVAADGGKGERNSPFTRNLLKAIQQPGQPIEEVFKEVRRNVTRETNGAQVPWESTSLTGFFSFRQTR